MTGIYMIRFGNDENMHFYIGQSVNIKRRKWEHLNELRNGTHANRYMQHVYDKCGEESMTFEVLCECTEDKLNELEEYYIYTMYAFADDGMRGMNLNTGGEGGQNFSAETKRKISEAGKGHSVSDETRKKISEALKWHTESPETRAKISEAQKGNKYREGKTASAKTRAKISEAQKGNKSCVGRKLSEETKQKISKANKGKPGRRGPDSPRYGKPPSPLAGKPKVSVICIETNEIFDSCAEAGRAYNVDGASINSVVHGKSKTCCGLHWKKYERSDGDGTCE